MIRLNLFFLNRTYVKNFSKIKVNISCMCLYVMYEKGLIVNVTFNTQYGNGHCSLKDFFKYYM